MFIPVDLLPRADSVPNTHDISYAAAENTTVLASAEPAQSGHKFLDIDVSTLYLILALFVVIGIFCFWKGSWPRKISDCLDRRLAAREDKLRKKAAAKDAASLRVTIAKETLAISSPPPIHLPRGDNAMPAGDEKRTLCLDGQPSFDCNRALVDTAEPGFGAPHPPVVVPLYSAADASIPFSRISTAGTLSTAKPEDAALEADAGTPFSAMHRHRMLCEVRAMADARADADAALRRPSSAYYDAAAARRSAY